MDKTVVVIGGGLGSLAGAIRLAKMGFKVSLFEKNERLGGKMNIFEQNGFRFDTGPSLLTMPFVIDELFEFTGYKRQEYLNFQRINPLCKYFFDNGSVFEASSDMEKMLKEIDFLNTNQRNNYIKYFQYTKKIYETTAEFFLFTPLHEIRKLISPKLFLLLLQSYKIDPFRTVNQSLEKFFNDGRLIKIFNRYTTYNGSNPFKAPATLNIIPYVEYGLGGYYIEGGMYRLVQALEKIARELGVEIYTSTPVEKIIHNRGRVEGITLKGNTISSDYVLCGADVVETHNKLLDGFSKIRKKLNQLEPSLSGMVFLWGIDKNIPELSLHNIIFSNDYQHEFHQIFEELKPPDDPTIYISISSKLDAVHAPSGNENWFVLLNMPYLTNNTDWHQETENIREKIIEKLYRKNIDVSKNIAIEKVFTPVDFHKLHASNRGSIYGISSNSKTTAFKRPPNRSRELKGLYFAGGSVHPGGGIPLVLLSGKIAAELIGEKEGILMKTNTDLVKVSKNYTRSQYQPTFN